MNNGVTALCPTEGRAASRRFLSCLFAARAQPHLAEGAVTFGILQTVLGRPQIMFAVTSAEVFGARAQNLLLPTQLYSHRRCLVGACPLLAPSALTI